MSIRVNSFGGPLVWFFRKHCSYFTSKVMLSYVEKTREKWTTNYIKRFNNLEETPLFQFVMLETVNRCNGECDFCPANKHAEKRPYMKMSDETIDKVINGLKEISFKGTIFPQVNNEPFLDKRMPDILRKIKSELPKCKIVIITNGTVLTGEKLLHLASYIDECVINDYSERYALSEHIRDIYRFVKTHREDFKDVNVIINRRYSHEILATRAGSAPNKKKKNNNVSAPCIYPFSDMIIFPNGNVGICCNDCFETTSFGNVNEEALVKIWRSESYKNVRKAMEKGREVIAFCQNCDVMDAGSRENALKNKDFLY